MKNIEDAHNDPNALFIDIGAKSKEDALKYVHVGSVCGYCGEYLPLANDLVCSKTFDDRVGCFQLIEALRENDGTYPNDIYYVFTVQEEVGCRGSKTTAAFFNGNQTAERINNQFICVWTHLLFNQFAYQFIIM